MKVWELKGLFQIYMVQLLIQGWFFSLNMNSLFYLELKTGRGMIQNMEAICWTQSFVLVDATVELV